MPRKFCGQRPQITFLRKTALKISGLDHASEEEEGGREGVWGEGDPPPMIVRHSNTSLRPTQCTRGDRSGFTNPSPKREGLVHMGRHAPGFATSPEFAVHSTVSTRVSGAGTTTCQHGA